MARHLGPSVQTPRRRALAFAVLAQGLRLFAALVLAALAASLVMEGTAELPLVALGIGLLVAAVGAALVSTEAASRAEGQAADGILGLYEHFAARAGVREAAGVPAGEMISGIARHPGSAAAALVTVPNAKAMSGIGAVAALALMAVFSWQAALLLTLTLPVMVIFMILVGGLTKARADRQEEALGRLSASFAEKVRCLPTILASHAQAREAERLGEDLAAYRQHAGSVLRVAFLNSGVLDFFSSLSVAMLAVFLGLGHLGLTNFPGFSGLTLASSLSILVLAPEVFAPLRRYAELYHQAAEGRTALDAAAPLLATEPARDGRLPAQRFALRGAVSPISGAYPDIDLPERGLVVISGSSGCGKTTLLRLLAGVDAPSYGQVFRPPGSQSWAASDAALSGETVAEVIGSDPDRWLRAVDLSGDPRFACGRYTRLGHGAGGLSGGQRLRLSLAAAAASGADTVFADEPTAKLDVRSAGFIRRLLKNLSADRLIVVASHDPVLIALADQHIDLQPRESISS